MTGRCQIHCRLNMLLIMASSLIPEREPIGEMEKHVRMKHSGYEHGRRQCALCSRLAQTPPNQITRQALKDLAAIGIWKSNKRCMRLLFNLLEASL